MLINLAAVSTPLRTKLLALAAATAGSLGLAPAAHAVAVTPTPASSMSEGYGWFFRFETAGVKEKVPVGSTIAIHASYDGVFDPAADPVVATAVFGDLLTYASVQVAVDDRVANPDRQHVWTFFYVPSAGIELTVPSHSVAVSDDDYSKQGDFFSFRMQGRTTTTTYYFAEPQASGTLRLKIGKKTIAKKKISNKTDGVKTSRVKLKIGKTHAAQLRKKRKITLEFKGSSAARDLYVKKTFKLKKSFF